MQPSSCFIPDKSNLTPKASHCWSGESNRKRKVDASDLDERSGHKMFLTEEKLIDNMRTLSLYRPAYRPTASDDQQKETNGNEPADLSSVGTQYELHTLFKDTLQNEELHDQFIHKLYELERKRFAMQIVPYMPIHPAQLSSNTNNVEVTNEEQNSAQTTSTPVQSSEVKKNNDDHLFKRPFSLAPYTVEEPCENTVKRTPRMKRSYSQSLRYNSNLTVVELKNDTRDSSGQHSQSDYFILEPSTPVLTESSTSRSSSSLSIHKSSVQITEYFDFPPSRPPFDENDVDTDFSLSFGACDQMDDDI